MKLLLVFGPLAAVASMSGLTCDKSLAELVETTAKVDGMVQTQGYETHEGLVRSMLNGDSGNPSSNYFMPFFNTSNTFPSGYCECVDDSEGCPWNTTSSHTFDPACAGGYVIGPGDALVLLICTPPPSRYFSFDLCKLPRARSHSRHFGLVQTLCLRLQT